MKYLLIFTLIGVTFSCPLDCNQVNCVQGFEPFDCPDGTMYVNNAALCGCCPGCLEFKKPGEECRGDTTVTFDVTNYYKSKTAFVSTGVVPKVASQDCAPGLNCVNTKCSDYTYTCNDPNPFILEPPACDIDGSYKAVQCKTKGSDPRCFCYSKEGNRIFGFDWLENAEEMKCQCSRLIEELKKNKANIDVTYHCSSNGNFEPLQCNRGICYCANVYTGQPTSFMVAEEWWTILPCYNETKMGFTYLKTCDSQSNALALIKKEMEFHGSDPVTLDAPVCDPDGSYYSKQCEGNQCYCRTRANVGIGAYITERNTAAERDQKCYCARDIVIFNDAGRPHTYLCDGGGNYLPLQTIGDSSFCVDQDGFLNSDIVKIDQQCTLPCATSTICPVNLG